MPSNYDHTAWFYDSLSKVVFGQTIKQAQIALLKTIPAHSDILIVGGGTGWILEEIGKVHLSGLLITYVEVSSQMNRLSKKRNVADNKVVFITDAIERVNITEPFDIIITPFLFDNFTPQQLPLMFKLMDKALKPGGLWLFTDFQIAGRWWHKPMSKMMYGFFKLFRAVEGRQIPDTLAFFKQHGYQEIYKETFYGDFIVSGVFKKGN
ncbi:class I SAM-dependent methyltransferase [Mucilaginibacter sp. KACC 22063]|uniref:class I SAM-dependent methyltransferase n=1 Tax=Mucilaginibacter sp. KACC 22063 TaxID=3025666 RepID=UPI002365E52F|nr:class I SAM-dependent methyltransferase [Mucilaginibacter sp. KACC 22063]WDF56207.1 class I SAM-dependent methyltransferase [Mucilaginibacter sp. KACC 22063]